MLVIFIVKFKVALPIKVAPILLKGIFSNDF